MFPGIVMVPILGIGVEGLQMVNNLKSQKEYLPETGEKGGKFPPGTATVHLREDKKIFSFSNSVEIFELGDEFEGLVAKKASRNHSKCDEYKQLTAIQEAF